MKKKDIFGNVREYNVEKMGTMIDIEDKDGNTLLDYFVVEGGRAPDAEPNLVCDCGCTAFKVCWWDYPYTGGYLKIKCSECGQELEIMDDYS